MKISVRANELATLLDRMPAGVRILSLDCFDTLLWRNMHSPNDLFADLPYPGGAREPRQTAEVLARRANSFEHGRSEVSIEQIYARLMPTADAAARAAAVQCELDAEARHCFGFEPTMALIRDAKARGLEVIVVSDTYLSAEQLRTLIARAAGEDVAAAIDRVFASSEYGMGKSAGLFTPVLKTLGVAPQTILHVGDNYSADQAAPAELGIATVHLRQFDSAVEHRLRMEAMMATMLEPETRTTVPAYQPHRAALSLREAGSAGWTLGHDVLGPVMHAFAGWVRDEAAELAKRTGKPVKLLFLMRDGYLPMQVFEALETGIDAHAVEISRLTSTRASFIDKDAISRYMVRALHRPADAVGRALMLSDVEIRKLTGNGDHMAFKGAVMASPVRARIVTRSKASADRMIAHLRANGVADGDAVMLIDLGYNGTVQNMVQTVLESRMGLTVAGRYLLLRDQEATGYDKRGFLDTRHYDYRALHALSLSISVVEQMCTVEQGSVIDYQADGTPIRRAVDLKGSQMAMRDEVQAGCAVFAANAGAGVPRPARSDDGDARRRMAAAALGRLLFLPSNDEVELLKSFDHDVNLGTDEIIKLVDVDQSADGLRRRGLQYLKDAQRMYLACELQPQGLAMNLSFFSISRFGMDLRGGDFQTGHLSVPTILSDGKSDAVTAFDAYPTHDGYYIMRIPIGAARFSAAVQFGEAFEMVQIEEVSVYDLESFAVRGAEPTKRQPIYDAMTPLADGVFQCSEAGMMFVEPPRGTHFRPMLLVVVFRPIVRRGGVALRKAA